MQRQFLPKKDMKAMRDEQKKSSMELLVSFTK